MIIIEVDYDYEYEPYNCDFDTMKCYNVNQDNQLVLSSKRASSVCQEMFK